MKSKLKKIVTKRTQKVFAESEVLVVLEKMEDNFKLLAEGQAGLENGQNSLREEMHRGISRIDSNINGLRNEMREGFSSIMDYLKRIDDEIMEIKKELKILKDKKVDWDGYSLLEKRVKNAEKEIAECKLILRDKKM